jgi:hypothetical protein
MAQDDRMTMALKEAFAGVGGSVWSSTLIYPMDFVKTRMQVPGAHYDGLIDAFQQTVKNEGFMALYTGLNSEVLKSAVQHFVYFYVYAFLKDFAQTRGARKYASQFGLCECDDGPSSVFSPATSRKGSEVALSPVTRSSSNPLDSVQSTDELMPMCCGACLKPVHLHASALEISAPDTPKGRGSSDDESNGTTPTNGQRKQQQRKPQQLNMALNLLIGIIAGCATQLFVTPLSVVQTRIMTQTKKKDLKNVRTPSIFAMLMRIAAEEGISALFAGIIPSLVLTANPAIQFVVFDRLKTLAQSFIRSWQKAHEGMSMTLPAAYSFLIGAIAKIAATLVTYPYIMAKVRLQWKGGAGAPKYAGTLDVIRTIIRDDGIFGLYTGVRAQMLKSVLGAALMFMGKERIMEYSNALVDSMRATYKEKIKKDD